ncbi:MAG: hypothetical protein J2P18_16215 [Nocardia sp.]|nr:hypothetical protein [Nocardia sp.]
MFRITLRPIMITVLCAVAGMPFAEGTAAAATPADPVQLAACDFGRQFATFDWSGYDDYVTRVLNLSTGPFHDQFAASANDRRAQVTATHSRSEANSVECRTEPADPAHPQISVTVDRSLRSDATLGLPKPQKSTMRVYLDQVAGHWLTSRVDNPI